MSQTSLPGELLSPEAEADMAAIVNQFGEDYDHGPKCGKGWNLRCSTAKSKRCKCSCGGLNHGALTVATIGKMADWSVFDPVDQLTGETRNYRYFILGGLPEAQENIVLWREGNAWGTNVPHTYVYHSPTGFAWGYGGSGPADLALNILALFVPPQEAWRLHQQYKWEVIARLDKDKTWAMPGAQVKEWIEHKWSEEPTD